MACVLIVDDDSDTRDSLEDILVGEGFEVRVASSGGEALAFLRREEAPSVILLDDIMPQMTGAEVLDWMRAHPAVRRRSHRAHLRGRPPRAARARERRAAQALLHRRAARGHPPVLQAPAMKSYGPAAASGWTS